MYFTNVRFNLYEKLLRILRRKIISRNTKRECLNFIKKNNPKKILIMNSSAYIAGMFKQRSHHFAELLSPYFDLVLYRSLTENNIQNWQNNIWLTKWIPDVRFKNAEVYYYTTSVNSYPYKLNRKHVKNGQKLIYDYMDQMSEDIVCTKNTRLLWKNLEKLRPELCIASSDKLFNDLQVYHPNVEKILVKNGVTTEHFAIEQDYCKVPSDLKDIVDLKRPIVGYWGYLAKWIDIELLNKAAKARPDYSFVYIGKNFNSKAGRLDLLPNVYILGRKDYSILPEYGVWFDCAVIPFKLGEIAKATSPVKLFEYMALKKPVVCTKDLIECYNYEGVLISQDHEDFIKKIDEAINISKDENIKNKLLMQAQMQSWKEKVNTIVKTLKLEEVYGK